MPRACIFLAVVGRNMSRSLSFLSGSTPPSIHHAPILKGPGTEWNRAVSKRILLYKIRLLIYQCIELTPIRPKVSGGLNALTLGSFLWKMGENPRLPLHRILFFVFIHKDAAILQAEKRFNNIHLKISGIQLLRQPCAYGYLKAGFATRSDTPALQKIMTTDRKSVV